MIITDQQRNSQHFNDALTPEQRAEGLTWDDLYLPSMKKLKDMGTTFNNAIIGASMCSPSRAAFMTSSYSFQNGVAEVGWNLSEQSGDPNIPNLCRLVQQEGYHINWKGKWHLGATDGTNYPGGTPQSLDGYINTGDYASTSLNWDPRDAGVSMGEGPSLGAGNYNNDKRFLEDGSNTFSKKATKADVGGDITYAPMPSDGESFNPAGNANTTGMLASLNDYFEMYQKSQKDGAEETTPFCLMASFVNPHDIHVFDANPSTVGYPLKEDLDNGFLPNCFDKGNVNNPPADKGFNIPVPPNAIHDGNKHHRSFLEKPTCQQYMEEGDSGVPAALYNLKSDPKQYSNGGMSDAQRFINFYAYLHMVVDRDISRLLAWFDQSVAHQALLDDTLIVRYADHGEQAISHGFREKGMSAYEETINVPLIVANPNFMAGEVDQVVSLIDIVPTLADIMGVEIGSDGSLPTNLWNASHPIYGKSFKSLIPELSGTGTAGTVHAYGVVFCYDDLWSFSNTPCYVRCLRTAEWAYAVYYDSTSLSTKPTTPVQYELYNLADTAFDAANPSAVLHSSVLQIENLAGISISETGITAEEAAAVEQQWKEMHYALMGLIANADIASSVPTIPEVSIPTSEMVNALPYNMDKSNTADAFTLWAENVMPSFTLKL